MRGMQKSVVAFALAGVLAGCGRAETGSVKFAVHARGSQARVAGETYVVTVSLTGPAARGPLTLGEGASPSDPWTGELDNLPVGAYTVTALAVESPSSKQFKSIAVCPVAKNAVGLCDLDLQQVGGTTTFNDTAPLISAISTSDDAAYYGETVTFSMTASFIGGGEPSISAACDAVPELPGAYGVSRLVISTPPLTGWDKTVTYSVELTSTCHGKEVVVFAATDAKGVRSAVSITANLAAQGLKFSATINHWPDINAISAEDAQVIPGGTVGVLVTAIDLDGDELTYAWTDNCSGAFDADAADPRYTAPETPGPCTLTVLVTDRKGGTNQGTLTLQIGWPGEQTHVIHAAGPSVIGVADSAPGLPGGSIKKVPGTPKAEYYFTPAELFGRAVTVGEVAELSYWTKKGTLHTLGDASDWYVALYTVPYAAGVTPTGKWYGARIGTDAYLSEALTETAGEWTHWSSAAGPNSLRFFESTSGYFGSYTDLHWAAFTAGNSLAQVSYGPQQIKYFSIQTSSNSAPTFDGQVAGFSVVLSDQSTALVNFGP